MGAKITLEHGYVDRQGQAPARRRHRLRHADGDRHREPDDGGDARQGAHDHRERRARARGRGAGARAQQDGRARRRAPAPSVITIEGVDELQPIEHAIIARPHRGRHVHGGGGAHPRRRAPARLPARAPRRGHRQAALGRRRGRRAEARRPARARRAPSSSPSTSRPQPYPGFPTDMQAQFMVLATQRARAERHHRDDLREPLHARAASWRAWAPTSTSTGAPRSSAA